jgi:hypothetical protein
MKKRSGAVTLTMVAALSFAASAQQSPGPCDASTFNPKVCKNAVRRGGFCSQGKWVPVTYQESYPYYYDLYQNYMSQGGVVDAAPSENCNRPHSGFFGIAHGGFGSHGASHSAHC